MRRNENGQYLPGGWLMQIVVAFAALVLFIILVKFLLLPLVA